MTRKVLLSLVLVLSFSLAVRGDDAKKDGSLQGAWRAEAVELGGQAFPEELRKTIKLVIEHDKYTVTVGPTVDKGICKFDAAAKPNALDITGTEGPNKGKTILAIYERSGDTLRVCYDLGGKNRPTEFKSKGGGQLFLVTYKLEAAEKDAAVQSELKALEGKWKNVACEARGLALPSILIPSFTFVAGAEGKCTGKMLEDEFQFIMTVDPKKDPKTTVLLHQTGQDKGKKQYGVYKLEGDKFTVCMTPRGAAESDRPKDFTTKGSRNVLFVFERVKEEDKP